MGSGEWRVRKEEERFLPAQAARSRKIIRDANDANDGRWGPFAGVARAGARSIRLRSGQEKARP